MLLRKRVQGVTPCREFEGRALKVLAGRWGRAPRSYGGVGGKAPKVLSPQGFPYSTFPPSGIA